MFFSNWSLKLTQIDNNKAWLRREEKKRKEDREKTKKRERETSHCRLKNKRMKRKRKSVTCDSRDIWYW